MALDHRARAAAALLAPDHRAGALIGRTKPFALTGKGMMLHAEMRRAALEREAVLLQDLTEKDRQELLRLLRLLHGRLPEF